VAAEKEEIEAQAEQVLAEVPDWIWNGEELPVAVEGIADTCFGSLVRDVPEAEANAFAAGLLMPANLVRERYKQLRGGRTTSSECARSSTPRARR
jgi:hypothetical protein